MKHKCAIDGCNTRISTDKLMCMRHWQMVPARLKRSVMDTWFNTNGDISALSDEDYMTARSDAIEAVERKVQAKEAST